MNKEIKQKVFNYFDSKKDEMINLLCNIVNIESVSVISDDPSAPFGKGVAKCLDYMLDVGKKEGFVTKNMEYHVGAISQGELDFNKTISFIGHLDVVPAEGDWKYDPYNATITNGCVVGRGASDDKAAVVAGLYIIKALKELNIKTNHNIAVLMGCNEETFMKDVKYMVKNYGHPKFSLIPDGGFPCGRGEYGRIRFKLHSNNKLSSDIISISGGSAFNIIPDYASCLLAPSIKVNEKEGIKISSTEKGTLVEAFGKSVHAAFGGDHPNNANKHLTDFLIENTSLSDEDKKILSFASKVNEDGLGTGIGINYTDEEGYTVNNATVIEHIDGHLVLTNDCRYAVTQNGEEMKKIISTNAKDNNFNEEIVEFDKPYYYKKDDIRMTTLLKVFNEFTGSDVKEAPIIRGGTYASHVPNSVFVGHSYASKEFYEKFDFSFLPEGHGSAHQRDEILIIDAFMNGIKLLFNMMIELDENI